MAESISRFNIPGVGPTTAEHLAGHFNELAELMDASIETLATINKVSAKAAIMLPVF